MPDVDEAEAGELPPDEVALLGDAPDEATSAEEVYLVPFEVESNYAGWRLDQFLCDKIRRLSRTQIQTILGRDLVYEGPRTLKPATRIWTGLVFHLRRRRRVEPDVPRTFTPCFEDADLLVVNKPAGLPMHATAKWFHNTLMTVLRAHQTADEMWDLPHRLERETSGLVMIGKRPEVSCALKMAFERHGTIHKEYLAIVHGWPAEDRFSIDAPLALLDHRFGVKMGVVPPPIGKEARTDVVVERRFERDVPWRGPALALVRCFPRTGRQHQLRVHLASRELPILGDKLYGPSEQYFADHADGALSDEAKRALVLPRHALHAAAIELPHPITKQRLRVEAPLPAELSALLPPG